MKARKKRSTRNNAFRPGASGECEAQLWLFLGPPEILRDNGVPDMHWVAAESLDGALLYLRKRHDDFVITEARFLGMIPCSQARLLADRARGTQPGQTRQGRFIRVYSLYQVRKTRAVNSR